MGKAQVQHVDPPSFETVWKALQETDRIVKGIAQRQEENARQMKETERIIKESAKETDRQMKETDRRLDEKLGKLGDRFGEMIEHMVMPGLVKKFRELGFVFTKAYPRSLIDDEMHNILTEIDITLENGDKVMIVEVKSKPNEKDIKGHLRRMEKVKAHALLHGDRRTFLGAIAGMVMKGKEKDFALRSGLYVVEPSGEEFVITVPEGIYSPREW